MTDKKLESDPKRQAVDPIRGYVYQFYQSVLAWINLGEDEILVLEGAEDFDLYQGVNVKTAQVKDTKKSGPFSLNQEEATKSLNNFWQHKQKNPEYKVEYHFLTTSPTGQELGNPLGENVKGVEYWQKVKNGDADLQPLREFLLSRKLVNSLMIFLRDSPDEIVIEELIKRIHWDTGQRAIEGLVQVIEAKLVSHGQRQEMPIPARDSLKALPQLLESVIHCIIHSEDRILLQHQFLAKYEEATGSLVPFAQQRPLMALTKQSQPTDVFESLRPIPKGACAREQLVDKLCGILNKQKILFLNGSTGTGKTTLAGLVAKIDSGEWQQLSMRGCKSSEVKNILSNASQSLISTGSPLNLILDDVNFTSYSNFESAFLGLAHLVKTNGAFVIITSHSEPPQDIYPKLWVDDSSSEKVPYFTEEDIGALLRIYGCSSDELIKATSTVIWLTTTGHPQLVHARVRKFEKLGWPAPDVKDLLQTPDTEKVKRDARARLINDLPNDATKELAYRLSILSSKFPKRIAFGLAGIKERIDKPGEAFEALLGPWVEDEGAGYYRISPLLTDAAKDNYGEGELKRFREVISLAYLKDAKTVSLSDASSALMQAFFAESTSALSLIAPKILIMPIDHRQYLSIHLFWLTGIASKQDSIIFRDNPVISTMLRHLQFITVAYSTNKAKGSDFATLWLDEIKDLKDDTLRNTSLVLAYGEILIAYDVPYNCGTIVNYFPEIMRLSDSSKDLKEIINRFTGDDHILATYGHDDPIRVLFSFLIPRIKSIEDVIDIFNALNELEQSDRDYLIEDFNSNNEFRMQLIHAGWIKAQFNTKGNL